MWNSSAIATISDSLDTSPTRTEKSQVALLCLVVFGYFEYCEFTRWLAGQWYLADVGNIHYCMVNTLRGRFMFSPMTESNHFGYHFTPLLVLLSPITLLSKYPIPLVTSYLLALSLCPAAVYKLARERGAPHWPALGLGLLFMGNHFVGSLHLATHFEVFFVLFFVCCMASRSGSRWFWIFAVLTLSTKEDAAVWVAAYSVFQWVTLRRPEAQSARNYLKLAVVCGVWLLVAGSTMLLVGSAAGEGARFYAERAGGIRFGTDSLMLFIQLMASFVFLPLFAGRAALLLLVPAPILLLDFPFMRHLLYYYSYPFLPYLALASAIGFSRVCPWVGRRIDRRRAGMAVAAFLVLCGAIQFFLPTRTDGYQRLPLMVTPRDTYRLQIASTMIPHNAPAVIQFGLWGITPTRPVARMLSADNVTSETYVFLDLRAPHGMERDEFISLAQSLTTAMEEKKRPMLHSSGEIYIIGPVTQEAAQ